MRLIWLAAACTILVVALLLAGEATLPLFGGDRVLAARVYKTLFMVLGAGIVAGLAPVMMAMIARFGRARMAGMADPPAFLPCAVRFFERAGPWLAVMLGLGGLVMALVIWLTN